MVKKTVLGHGVQKNHVPFSFPLKENNEDKSKKIKIYTLCPMFLQFQHFFQFHNQIEEHSRLGIVFILSCFFSENKWI